MQVARLNCLIKGYSGIGADALHLMGELPNRGIHPLVPEQGSLGASGDLAPLAHLALPLIAAGRVRKRRLLELLATKVPAYRDDEGIASDFLAEVRNTVLTDEADALLPALDIPADPV